MKPKRLLGGLGTILLVSVGLCLCLPFFILGAFSAMPGTPPSIVGSLMLYGSIVMAILIFSAGIYAWWRKK